MSRFVAPSQAMPADEGIQCKAAVKWFNVAKGFGFVAPEDGQGDAFLHISVLNRAGLQQIGDGAELSCMIAPGNKGRQITRILEVISEGSGNSGGEQGSGYGGGRNDHSSGYGGRNDHSSGYGGRNDHSSGYGGRNDHSSGYGGRNDQSSGYGGRDNYSGGERGGGGRGGYANDSHSSGGYGKNRPPAEGPEVEVNGTVKWFKPDKGFGFVAADDGDKDIFVHKSLLRRANINDLESGQRVRVRATTAAKGREATWIALAGEE